MMSVIDGVDGLRALAGQSLGVSTWHEMAFEDIVRFADATGDHQWLHVDRERCLRESPYGAPIAHGYFTVALIAGLFFTVVEVKGFKAVVNYGMDKVRFPTPLRAGSQYRLVLGLAEVREVKGGFEGVMNATIEVQGEPKPACAATIIYRFLT
jgi:acyl dehydratase